MNRRAEIVLLLGTMPAAVAPFVASIDHYVPFEISTDTHRDLLFNTVAAPFLLGGALALWQVRRCLTRPLTLLVRRCRTIT